MKLGRLEKVELRSFWKKEDRDFTPWLAQDENIQLLSETIGIELEVQSQEEGVGPFRADILCMDMANNHFVLIENQLEKTDHTHLGQLMTYAAGLDAVSIIWIAQKFTEEHRAALDWLNRITDSTFNFFGIEI
jgi:RecB family endonuclease NucS